MKSANDYLKDVERIAKTVNFEVGTIQEAKTSLLTLKIAQQDLRLIKKELTLVKKTIRAEYQQKMGSAGGFSAGFFQGFGKRKLAGSIRADAKRELIRKRDNEIGPYDRLGLMIDDLLNQMSVNKLRLDEFVARLKARNG